MQFGNIESAGRVISGWAIDLNQVDQRCLLDVCVNGKTAFTVLVGDLPRADAASSVGASNINSGFNIDVSSLLNDKECEISVKFNSTGELLDGNNPFTGRAQISKLNVFSGLNEYLFYSGDKNEVVNQMLGAIVPVEEDIQLWADRVCLAHAATSYAGGKFVLAIVPDKIAIAPHLLSEDAILSECRTVVLLEKRLKNVYGIDLIYPLEKMRSSIDSELLLDRNDSHLNMRAQYFMFNEICTQLGIDPRARPNWVKKLIVHDLAIYDGSNKAELSDIPHFDSDSQNTIRIVRSRGSSVTIYINPLGALDLIFVSGHSSCKLVSTFIKEISKVTVVFDENKILTSRLTNYRPDVVIQYISERNLYNISNLVDQTINPIDNIAISRSIELSKKMSVSNANNT